MFSSRETDIVRIISLKLFRPQYISFERNGLTLILDNHTIDNNSKMTTPSRNLRHIAEASLTVSFRFNHVSKVFVKFNNFL